MSKLVKFYNPVPERFGPQRVRRRKNDASPAITNQLDLFSGARVVRMNQLSTFEEALQLDEQGNKPAARELYYKAIADGGEDVADAYCNLGILESQSQAYPKAIDCFTKCLVHNSRHFEAHYNLANAYGEVGNFALAKVHYEIAIEIEPAFTNSYFNLGLIQAMNKEFKAAVRTLRRYCQVTPVEDHGPANDLISKLSFTL